MYEVYDTFNHGVISRHRLLRCAIASLRRYRANWKPYMGSCRATVCDSQGDMDNYTHPRHNEYISQCDI